MSSATDPKATALPTTSNIEESRAQRLQKQRSKFRDRGGVFVPSQKNELIDILLSRKFLSTSPKKPGSPTRRKSKGRPSLEAPKAAAEKGRRKSAARRKSTAKAKASKDEADEADEAEGLKSVANSTSKNDRHDELPDAPKASKGRRKSTKTTTDARDTRDGGDIPVAGSSCRRPSEAEKTTTKRKSTAARKSSTTLDAPSQGSDNDNIHKDGESTAGPSRLRDDSKEKPLQPPSRVASTAQRKPPARAKATSRAWGRDVEGGVASDGHTEPSRSTAAPAPGKRRSNSESGKENTVAVTNSQKTSATSVSSTVPRNETSKRAKESETLPSEAVPQQRPGATKRKRTVLDDDDIGKAEEPKRTSSRRTVSKASQGASSSTHGNNADEDETAVRPRSKGAVSKRTVASSKPAGTDEVSDSLQTKVFAPKRTAPAKSKSRPKPAAKATKGRKKKSESEAEEPAREEDRSTSKIANSSNKLETIIEEDEEEQPPAIREDVHAVEVVVKGTTDGDKAPALLDPSITMAGLSRPLPKASVEVADLDSDSDVPLSMLNLKTKGKSAKSSNKVSSNTESSRSLQAQAGTVDDVPVPIPRPGVASRTRAEKAETRNKDGQDDSNAVDRATVGPAPRRRRKAVIESDVEKEPAREEPAQSKAKAEPRGRRKAIAFEQDDAEGPSKGQAIAPEPDHTVESTRSAPASTKDKGAEQTKTSKAKSIKRSRATRADDQEAEEETKRPPRKRTKVSKKAEDAATEVDEPKTHPAGRTQGKENLLPRGESKEGKKPASKTEAKPPAKAQKMNGPPKSVLKRIATARPLPRYSIGVLDDEKDPIDFLS